MEMLTIRNASIAFVGLLLAVISLPSTATVIYNVQSTSVTNCAGAPHGLWTNDDIAGACGNYFDIQDGSTFTIFNDDANSANWTAELDATAINPYGLIADIFITFSGFAESNDPYKQEGGAAYDPNTDFNTGILADPSNTDIDFFTLIDGSISIDNNGTVNINNMVGNYAFQFGLGANAKSVTEFGGSAWIVPDGLYDQDHWDLNLTFVPVPEPTSLVLMGIGLLVIFSSRRRLQILEI